MKTLTHITDVGSPAHDGIDSTERIRNQYLRLGVEPLVVTAGQSPLHVAFAACTDVSLQARENVEKVLSKLGLPSIPLPPTALNSAPRNSTEVRPNGKEDYIFRVKYEDGETFLIYGPEVLKWVLTFRNQANVALERILEIPEIIPDTSNGSQFRSAEHLPIVHYLESEGKLDEHSEREQIDETVGIPDATFDDGNVVVLPPDEYGNGRLLARKALFDEILAQDTVRISEISGNCALYVRQSLTEVIPYKDSDFLSVWPSSNHFNGDRFGVLNVGTRWSEGETSTKEPLIIDVVRQLRGHVGKSYKVGI